MIMTMLLAVVTAWTTPPAETTITSTLEAVTVFRRGAQLQRSAEGRVPAGQSILKFTGLSANLMPASIQFQSTGDFTIQSISFQRNYINPLENSAEAKALDEQIKTLAEQIRREEIELEVLREEESLLLTNKEIGGAQTGVQLEDLKGMAAYYRQRLKEIKIEKLESELRIRELKEQSEKLQQQMQEVVGRLGQRASGEIWVTVNAERALTAQFQISYIDGNARWSPMYDIRVDDINEPVRLDMKAQVAQSTGEEWEDVVLTLSTGIPTESGVRPVLQPWWLAPYQPPVAYNYRPKSVPPMPQGAMREQAESYAADEAIAEEADAEYVQVEQVERATSREYRVTMAADIPADGKDHVVAIEQYTLPAEYEYYVAPKLDRDVFLTAKISGWETYNLLSGPANLFFEGSYQGKTQLDVRQTIDTLKVSLGRDKGIVVTRTQDEQFRDRQLLSNKVTRTTGWTIELRNTKSRAVDIVVEDQIPLSTTDEIEVSLEKDDGATLDKSTGTLRWRVSLQPGETEKLNFRYEVKHPKRLQVVLE